jgi:hypothetical protein
MMTRLMLNLRDPKLNGYPEGPKLTPITFNGPIGSGATGDFSMNTRSGEGSLDHE